MSIKAISDLAVSSKRSVLAALFVGALAAVTIPTPVKANGERQTAAVVQSLAQIDHDGSGAGAMTKP